MKGNARSCCGALNTARLSLLPRRRTRALDGQNVVKGESTKAEWIEIRIEDECLEFGKL